MTTAAPDPSAGARPTTAALAAALSDDSVLDALPVAAAAADADGRITRWNAAAEDLIGRAAADTVGRRFWDIGLTSESRADVLSAMPSVLDGGRMASQTELRATDGRAVPVHLVIERVTDDTGAVVGYVGVAIDLSVNGGAAPALRAIERRFGSRLEDDVVAFADADGGLRWIGPGLANAIGRRRESLSRTHLDDLIHPDDGGPEWLADVRTAPGGVTARRRVRLRHADGSWRMIDARLLDMLDESPVGGIVFQGRDCTDRAAADEAHRRLARVVETTGAAVAATTLDRIVVTWNPGAEQLYGWPADDMVGRDCRVVVPTAQHAKHDELFARVAAGESVAAEVVRRHRDGRELLVSLNASPARDERGQIVAVSFIAFEVGERRRTERERNLRARQQQALAGLGQRALAGATMTQVYEESVALIGSLLDLLAVEAFDLLPLDAGGGAVVAASFGADGRPPGEEIPGDAGWLHYVRRSTPPLVIEDLATERRFEVSTRRLDSATQSAVVVTIDGGRGPIGLIAAHAARSGAFAAADIAFVQAIANVVGAAVERDRAAAELRRLALHDPVTGLPNRRLVIDRLERALDRHGELTRLAVLFVDLDRFKRVNDTLGHRAGDEVLETAAARLLAAVRGGDTVARLGGDEFLVLCEDVLEPMEAVAVADRITGAMTDPVRLGPHEVVVTASVGIAFGSLGDEPESLVRDADVAMYRAKQRGRSRVEVFDDAMRDEVVERLAIEEDLRRAITTDQLHVAYQPQVRMADGMVVGVEALVRWHHPHRGVVLPGAFIGVAEDVGLLPTVDRIVLAQAVRAGVRLRNARGPLSIAVNISAQDLDRPTLTDELQAALAAGGLPPEALVLEITETALLDERHRGVGALQELRAIGVKVSVDDFGTGYSSLARLSRLPVDEVKIDRDFIEGVGRDRSADAIVQAVVALGRALDLRVVAEGVEREDQRLRLGELGCEIGQGWLWTGPRPIDDLLAWAHEVDLGGAVGPRRPPAG